MKKRLLVLLLSINSNIVLAEWTATIKKNLLTDRKEGVATIRPSNDTAISLICTENESPRFAVTWKEPNSASQITHYQYRVNKEKIIVINVSGAIGDRTTVSSSSIKSIFKDLVRKNRLIVKGRGAKYETSIIVADLDQSAIALKKACSWHPFYQDVFTEERKK